MVILAFIVKCILITVASVILLLAALILGLKVYLGLVKGICRCKVKLNGKVALISGGNSGLGLETARDLAKRGATVIIASRDDKKSKAAVEEIITDTGNPKVYYRTLDLAKFSSIKKFAKDFNDNFERLDILVNNAGCVGIIPRLTEDGIEKVTQINYVGPFLLTELLKDKLLASQPSRIVIVSSKANEYHDFEIDDIAGLKRKSANCVALFRIYANTKLCNILWAKALAKRLPAGVTANALHPGVVKTDIFNKIPTYMRGFVLWMIGSFFKNAEEGAQTIVHLCVSPELEHVSGEYFADCKITEAHKVTLDDDFVEKLWDGTVELIEGSK